MEIQVPYHNYTVWEFENGTLSEVKTFDKYLPRVWKNLNSTLVKSFATIPVNFYNTYDVAKVFMIKNLGYIKESKHWNAKHDPQPWNFELPEFKQAGKYDIHNYPSNFKKLMPKSNITAGNKTLTFLQIQESKNMPKVSKPNSFFMEDQALVQKMMANSTKKSAAAGKKKKIDDNYGAAIF